jgi:hypothetical protein
VLLNPEPETVSVNAAEPAVSAEGLTELIVGTVADGVPPLPAEEEVPLEHPVKEARRTRVRETTERRNEADDKRDGTEQDNDDRLSVQDTRMK